MSAKFMYSLSDENPDLQKQIGCMNGIFQLFDRHSYSRRIIGQNQRRLPAGQTGKNGMEARSAVQKPMEKYHKVMKEKQRVSTESSRTSFSSSSCSSSLSSLECSKASQLEPASFGQSLVHETPARESSVYQPNASCQSGWRQSLDIRDVVKDSIYREPRGLSVKTGSRGEAGGQTLKYIDSPRPCQDPKHINPKVLGLKESFHGLQQLQEASCKSSERKHGYSASALRDTRRFSCDGRESRETLKSTIKLKELPRFSLDSRAGSIRGYATELKSYGLLENMERGAGNSKNFLTQQEEPGSRGGASSVVAKLMGLEALPDPMSTNESQIRHVKAHSDVESDSFSVSSRMTDQNKHRISGPPRNTQKEPISPRLRKGDLVKKHVASSKFPTEPAPWRQPNGNRGSQAVAVKSTVPVSKALTSPPSVYGEIEKRLAQVEFKKSGKDLRALKQILEAMQKTKEILEGRNAASYPATQTSSDSSINSSPYSASQQNLQSECPTLPRGTGSKGSKSPIVNMKPSKPNTKAANHALPVTPFNSESTEGKKEAVDRRPAKHLTPRTNLRVHGSQPHRHMDATASPRLITSEQFPKEPQSAIRDTSSSSKSSGTVYLRQKQKKHGLEKPLRPTIQSSDSLLRKSQSPDSNMTRRQPSRHLIGSVSPHRKPNKKNPTLQPSDEELSAISSDVRDHQGDVISQQSDSNRSNRSVMSQVDEEVSSTIKYDNTHRSCTQQSHRRQKNHVVKSTRDGSSTEPAIASSEQPSPVSVLDAAFYDEMPSPIKKISVPFKDDAPLNSYEVDWIPGDINNSSRITYSMVDMKKVKDIQPVIQDLKQVLSAYKEHIPDCITPFINSADPDHRYITEILLASGLLKDFESSFLKIHLHPSSNPINPNLFHALEQAKSIISNSNDEHTNRKTLDSGPHAKIQRRLTFDLVNEIVVQKLVSESSSKQWFTPKLLADKSQAQQLLEELCSEIDRLQEQTSIFSFADEDDSLVSVLWEDQRQQSTHWTACHSEIPGLVLDVERLIFKDLITEVVNGETLQGLSGRHCRQLFCN